MPAPALRWAGAAGFRGALSPMVCIICWDHYSASTNPAAATYVSTRSRAVAVGTVSAPATVALIACQLPVSLCAKLMRVWLCCIAGWACDAEWSVLNAKVLCHSWGFCVRSVDAALRRAIPTFNTDVRAVQVRALFHFAARCHPMPFSCCCHMQPHALSTLLPDDRAVMRVKLNCSCDLLSVGCGHVLTG